MGGSASKSSSIYRFYRKRDMKFLTWAANSKSAQCVGARGWAARSLCRYALEVSRERKVRTQALIASYSENVTEKETEIKRFVARKRRELQSMAQSRDDMRALVKNPRFIAFVNEYEQHMKELESRRRLVAQQQDALAKNSAVIARLNHSLIVTEYQDEDTDMTDVINIAAGMIETQAVVQSSEAQSVALERLDNALEDTAGQPLSQDATVSNQRMAEMVRLLFGAESGGGGGAAVVTSVHAAGVSAGAGDYEDDETITFAAERGASAKTSINKAREMFSDDSGWT